MIPGFLAAPAARLRERIPYLAGPATSGTPPSAPPRHSRRVRTPSVLQMEAVECGAASLAMILGYHGRIVPLEELRSACGISRDGSKASNILRAARSYGLNAVGFKKEPAALRELPVPMIVHWNFNHFVVLEGFKSGRAFLNDPAGGSKVVTEEEFDQSFTGVVLVFEKTADFVAGGSAPSLIAALGRRLRGVRTAVTFAILAGLALVVPGLITPSFNKIFIDGVLVKGLTSWTMPLLLIMGATAVISAGLMLAQQKYLLRLETRLSVGASGRFFWHVLRLPVDFFTQRYAGEISTRIAMNDRIARLLSGDLATNAINVLVVVFYGALLFKYDVALATMSVVTVILNIAALRWANRKRTELNARLIHDRGRMMGTGMGGLQTIETLKATGAESDFFAQWAGYQAKVSNTNQELQVQSLWLAAIPPTLMAITGALVIGIGGSRVIDGVMTMGMLICFQALMAAFMGPINRMADLGGQLQEVKTGMNRLDDVLQAAEDPSLSAESVVPDEGPVRLSGLVEFRNVTFGYGKLDPPLIENFNLTIRPGARVALVGGSGCGKSTLAKLTAGLYEPWSGQVLFDGRERKDIPRAVMTASFAVVDQDICLFQESIKGNLALWDTTVAENDITRAARDAHIHEDIAGRPNGYASEVGEGGRNFSGGQRQRLEIARALVGNPTIIVLDEATSALDPTTEQQIDDNLRRRGCSCLIIAHRLSTIRDCDEIIVLDRGRVVQRGTHAQLAAAPGRYRDLTAAE